MTPSRRRRLAADHEQIQRSFTGHPQITVTPLEGDPPERYAVEFRLRSLAPSASGSGHQVRTVHRAEVFLPLDYPRRPPFCRMTTPVFHPNIDPQKICIGDHWSAGQSLASLVVRIGEMLAYQSYNVRSPLNGAAAAWAAEHVGELPLDRADLAAGTA
jgi:ubiquitin-protein ligase